MEHAMETGAISRGGVVCFAGCYEGAKDRKRTLKLPECLGSRVVSRKRRM